MFKKNQKLRCIESSSVPAYGRKGDIMVVVSDQTSATVQMRAPCGSISRLLPKRFELVTEEFKVGDRVRGAQYKPTSSLFKGFNIVGVIEKVTRDTLILQGGEVIWSEGAAIEPSQPVLYGSSFSAPQRLAPAPAKPVAPPVPVNPPKAGKQWIISLLKADGTLAPAETPKPYTSRVQADHVAKDMATKHAGQTFVVFEAVSAAVIPAPVVQLQTL